MRPNHHNLAAGFIGGLCAAVLLSGTAIAATGGNMIIGRKNLATTKTALVNPNGTALELGAHGAYPPLLVGRNRNRVPHLNADLLDGLDSSQLQRADVQHFAYYEDELWPAETIGKGVGWAYCPPDTVPVAAGFEIDGTGTDSAEVRTSVPFEDEFGRGWAMVVEGDETYGGHGRLVVTCYSPTGEFPPGSSPPAQLPGTPSPCAAAAPRSATSPAGKAYACASREPGS